MPVPPRRFAAFLIAVLAGVALLAGCGDDGGDSGLRIDGLDIRFHEDRYEAAPGPVQLDFRNRGSLAHNVVFRAADGAPVAAGEDDFVAPGATAAYDLDLVAGEYEFYCSVPGHEEAGMIATLVVG